LGSQNQLDRRELIASGVIWSGCVPPTNPIEVTAKIRYKDEDTPCKVIPLGEDRIRVVFENPKRAITPGQSVVLYCGEDMLGGAVIEAVVE
jgi:tRNA-specific 2-thiouridylase